MNVIVGASFVRKALIDEKNEMACNNEDDMACKCRSNLSKKIMSWKTISELCEERQETNMARRLLEWRRTDEYSKIQRGLLAEKFLQEI